MSATPIRRLLLVEDDPGFARLLRAMFADEGSAATDVTHVDTMLAAETTLATESFDIILLDPGLPDSQGIGSVRRAHAAAKRVPLVVLTGRNDESFALHALQAGAQDYLIKGQIDTRGLLRFLRYAVERNVMDATLFVERERAHVTLDSIGDGVASTDTAGKITFLNLVAQRMTGWTSAEAEGRPVTDVIRILDGVTRETIAFPTDAASVESARPSSDSLLVRRDGFEISVEESVAPIHDRDGRIAGTVIVFRDVTAAHSNRLALLAVSTELERSNRELEDFATIASHDLQEPLRKIQAFGERLSERAGDGLDADAREYLDRMTTAAGRMQSLINDLLHYSQVTLHPEAPRRVDLRTVVGDVLSDLDESLRMTGGAVHVGFMPIIEASPFQMRQLFQNLIANALKFHPVGVAPDVHVETVPHGDLRHAKGRSTHEPIWEIRVRDNGIGFDDKYADRIFAPFQRLHGRGEYQGTGMGLAICRRIVARHGGTITAEATVGQGATFVITLPRTTAVARPELLPVRMPAA